MNRRVPVRLLDRGLEQRRFDDLPLAGLLLVHVRRADSGDRKDAGVDDGTAQRQPLG